MVKISKNMVALTGADAVAEAIRQINPDVVAVYPITPQTPIAQKFATFVADGKVDSEMIRVESEHSAMSATVGASAAGARAMTATSSNGLALMHEIVYIAASTRLPIVMPVVNRALSGPINIHCDHSDSMAERDSGWLQIYNENAQEAYDATLIAMVIAEHPDVRLPVMVCQDGFITSHSVENVEILPDTVAKKFVGKHLADFPLLDVANPVTYGPLDLTDYYFEHKYQQRQAMDNSVKIIKQVAKQYKEISGRSFEFMEKYKLSDADYVIVTMSSTAGTTKAVVDSMRKQGKKVGLLKLKVFRPFPFDEIVSNLSKAKKIAVLDRADSFGALGGPLFNEIRSAFYESKVKPEIYNYIFGLGGREIGLDDIENVYKELMVSKKLPLYKYYGVRK
ncbi:pyruvate ferredoxin oxidoreductase [Candidatus Woesearchaeota archaeon]|nr:pyruvate ferredoxin oxidoreductase [Candidatus Woesearchaeota archaeon]